MKTTTSKRTSQSSVVVIHGAHAHAVIKSLELSNGKKPLTISSAIDLWTSWLRKNPKSQFTEQSISYIKVWARDADVGSMAVCDIEEEHVNGWVNEGDIKLNTRRIRLAIVRSFFKFLAIKELLTAPNPSTLASVDFNSLSHKQKESREVKPFSAAEFEKLVDYLDDELDELQPKLKEAKAKLLLNKLLARRNYLTFWKSAAVISRCSGLRLGDICQLEWDCIGKQFTVWTDKRNKRVQPHLWNEDLFDETIAQIPADNAQYCFPSQRLDYLDPKRRPGLSIQFTRLCEKLKINRGFHSLRHTYASECRKAGISMPHIAESMGHSNTKTTEGYVH